MVQCVIFRSLYVYINTYMYIITMKKEVLNLNRAGRGIWEGLEG